MNRVPKKALGECPDPAYLVSNFPSWLIVQARRLGQIEGFGKTKRPERPEGDGRPAGDGRPELAKIYADVIKVARPTDGRVFFRYPKRPLFFAAGECRSDAQPISTRMRPDPERPADTHISYAVVTRMASESNLTEHVTPLSIKIGAEQYDKKTIDHLQLPCVREVARVLGHHSHEVVHNVLDNTWAQPSILILESGSEPILRTTIFPRCNLAAVN